MQTDEGGSDSADVIQSRINLGVKASFSRPPTGPPNEEEQNQTTNQIGDRSGTSRLKQAGVLLTELDDDTENDEATVQPVHQTIEEEQLREAFNHADVINARENINGVQSPPPKKADIFDEKEWDTDLEEEEEENIEEKPMREQYPYICEKHGCSPCSYFHRHIDDKELHMKHHGLNKDECCALAMALRSIVYMETVDLEDNWLKSSGCRHLCKMLEDNDTIQELNLAQNKLGSASGVCVGQMLRINHTMRSLSLADNGFDDITGSDVIEALEDSRMQVIDLSKNSFSDKSGIALGPVLAANDYLEELDLSWNMIRGTGAVAMAKGLKENIRLRVLDLSWNGLGERGGAALADSLLVNTTIKELSLSSNRLNQVVALKFVKVINQNESLSNLKLDNNPITTSGAVSLVTALLNSPVTTMEYLSLEGNPVEFEFLRTLKELQSVKSVKVTYGSILRSGNTSQDIGKPAVDPSGPKKAVLIMEENLIINNTKRLQEIFAKYYVSAAEKGMCNPNELIECLTILSPGLNVKQLTNVVNHIPRNEYNQIPLRKLFESQQTGAPVKS